MPLKRISAVLAASFINASLGFALPALAETAVVPEVSVELSSIDGFSVKLPANRASFTYQYFVDGSWSDSQTYESDGDTAAGEESELIMVPDGTSKLRANVAAASAIHPITVSHEPVKTRVAAVSSVGLSSVISRSDWGADEDYLFESKTEPASSEDAAKGDSGGDTVPGSQRVKDCQLAQQNFPSEFSVGSLVTKDAQGRAYRWPLQYSRDVKLLVVHHSALLIKGDPRPAVERVRALFKYHAATKGWGDIGYNFIIDEVGQVYEGRVGGKFMVGGHTYCNNTGTIGIVMLGNFEIEQPSDAQVKGLQRLLASLANDYQIDVGKSVQFHGKKFSSPIIRHRDLLSTLCPGYYLTEAFGQVVKNVQNGRLDTTVIFPQTSFSSSSDPATTINSADALKPATGISFTGRNSVAINPGGKQRLSFTYTADRSGAYEGKKVADIRLSDQRIKLWLDNGVAKIPVTKGILLESDLPAFETTDLQLIVQAPMEEGSYSLDIGGLRFTLSVSGRRARSGNFINPFGGNPALIVEPPSANKVSTLKPRLRLQSRPSRQSSSADRAISVPVEMRARGVSTPKNSTLTRIRLSASQNPSVVFTSAGEVGGVSVRAGTTVDILPMNGRCEARQRGESLVSRDILRFAPKGTDTLTVHGVASKTRTYRGVLECRVLNGSLALINELSLEDYLAGLAEEPDTEPYEKQRAFAIAARTYAAFYTDPANRKFPGMPYDGSDDPGIFQAYAGVEFEAKNPRWVRAVESTEHSVLRYRGELIKPAYFSSNDGKTRTPAEAGWKNFPAAEIFTSKPDPWCVGMTLRGHGVGMSGCGALGQAKEGRSAEQILQYYYPGTLLGGL